MTSPWTPAMTSLLLLMTSLFMAYTEGGGYEEERPYFFPIYPHPQNTYYEAGFRRTYDGVEALYRNDQRQEYVNNIAYKHGTGLGTAPWYGVPGTSYDFSHATPVYGYHHATPSHPHGYGYSHSAPQYHNAPSYHQGYGGGGGYGGGNGGGGSDGGGYGGGGYGGGGYGGGH